MPICLRVCFKGGHDGNGTCKQVEAARNALQMGDIVALEAAPAHLEQRGDDGAQADAHKHEGPLAGAAVQLVHWAVEDGEDARERDGKGCRDGKGVHAG